MNTADDTAHVWEETTGNPVICLQEGEKYCSSDNKNEIETFWTCKKEEGTDFIYFPLRRIHSSKYVWDLFTRLVSCPRNRQKKKLPPSPPQPKSIELNREKASPGAGLTLGSSAGGTGPSACVQISSPPLLMWK